MLYEIIIKGYVQPHWFESLTVKQEDNFTTILHGEIKDQAELFGILRRIQGLGIELIALKPTEKEDHQ